MSLLFISLLCTLQREYHTPGKLFVQTLTNSELIPAAVQQLPLSLRWAAAERRPYTETSRGDFSISCEMEANKQ